MSGDADNSSKTEEATPEKQRRVRDEGHFPRSRDAGAVAASGAIVAVILGLGPGFVSAVFEFSRRCFYWGGAIGEGDWNRVGRDLVMTLAVVALPTAIAGALAGLAVGLLEAGFNPRLELVAPKWNRVDPWAKLQGLFSLKSAALNVALSLGKVLVVGAATYWVVRDEWPLLLGLGRLQLDAGVDAAVKVLGRLVATAVGALVLLSVLDYLSAWFRHRAEIRMTRQEVKEEHLQQEGDPRVRVRLRQRARELVRRGLAREVKTCAVVVANPTHVAVGLRYRPEEGVPIVAAKGYDEVALYIRRLARESSVPIIENRPLARSLASQVRVGRAIPADLYVAVAETLAVVYRLQARRSR